MKYYSVCLEGIDKTGKDTIWKYVDYISGRNLVINSRGVVSQLAYNELYNRNSTYDLEQQANTLHVLLTVDKSDWEIRCKITKEPKIPYEENVEVFEKAFKLIEDSGFPVMRFNTSEMTPYQVAIKIVEKINKLNKETN